MFRCVWVGHIEVPESYFFALLRMTVLAKPVQFLGLRHERRLLTILLILNNYLQETDERRLLVKLSSILLQEIYKPQWFIEKPFLHIHVEDETSNSWTNAAVVSANSLEASAKVVISNTLDISKKIELVLPNTDDVVYFLRRLPHKDVE